MNLPVNHPTAPVINLLGVGLPSPADCKALKAKYKLVARQHKKGAKKSTGKESHHILQDAAMKPIISKASGWAVLLGKRAHRVINALQTSRNCSPGAPVTLGALVKASRDDLESMFKNSMPAKDARDLANCLTMEAIKESQKRRRKKGGRRAGFAPNSRVAKVGGCLAAETLIPLADARLVAAALLRSGMRLRGGLRIHRFGACTSQLIRIDLAGGSVRVTPAHRVRLANGEYQRADHIVRGTEVHTLSGPSAVLAAVHEAGLEPVFGFDFASTADLPVGNVGLWLAMPKLGARVRATVTVRPAVDPVGGQCAAAC